MNLLDGEIGLLENVARSAHIEGLINDETLATLLVYARRDWAVRVLDAWALYTGRTAFRTFPTYDDAEREGWECFSHNCVHPRHFAPTPDAARLAAAEAVWPELPESVRTELGERP